MCQTNVETSSDAQAAPERFTVATLLDHLALVVEGDKNLFFNACLLASYSNVFLSKLTGGKSDWLPVDNLYLAEEKYDEVLELLRCLDLRDQKEIDDSNVELITKFAVAYEIPLLKKRICDHIVGKWQSQPEKFLMALQLGVKLSGSNVVTIFTPLAAQLPIKQLVAERNSIPLELFKTVLNQKSVDADNVDQMVQLAEELDLNQLSSTVSQFVSDNWHDNTNKFLPAVSIAIRLKQKSLAESFLPRAAILPVTSIMAFRENLPIAVVSELALQKAKVMEDIVRSAIKPPEFGSCAIHSYDGCSLSCAGRIKPTRTTCYSCSNSYQFDGKNTSVCVCNYNFAPLISQLFPEKLAKATDTGTKPYLQGYSI